MVEGIIALTDRQDLMYADLNYITTSTFGTWVPRQISEEGNWAFVLDVPDLAEATMLEGTFHDAGFATHRASLNEKLGVWVLPSDEYATNPVMNAQIKSVLQQYRDEQRQLTGSGIDLGPERGTRRDGQAPTPLTI